ncbi:MAG: IS1634 family transposase [Verrucomicrobiota bacterium]
MQAIDRVVEDMQITRADHLPIVSAFCRRIRLVETINRVVPTSKEVDVGTVVQAMVLDTLSGRSPLYRLADFFKHQDTQVLLGRPLSPVAFNDTTVGRVMDVIFEAGAGKLFSEVAFQACKRFPLDMSHVHFDTTSVNVWGDYDRCSPDADMINLTYGHSKDHRPDLKQFLIKMLCVGRNIPILGNCEDGNKSDKSINNTVLNRISSYMARHGLSAGAFTYIADAAMVTEKNLNAIGDNLFITRLPFSYNEADRVVSEAVAEGCWEPVGTLNETPVTRKRPSACYKIAEKTVLLYGQPYRAVVVHSTAHDKRRIKRIERQILQSDSALKQIVAEHCKPEYLCRPDALAAAERLRACSKAFHRLETSVTEKIRYARGRPPKNAPRKIASVRWIINASVVENTELIEIKRQESGCFVLLCNVPHEGVNAKTGAQLLRAYKEQYGIERNFSFLKDPLIVNDLFLKKPERIEALGAVLLSALLVYNLIEFTLRHHIEQNDQHLPGWDNKPTQRPTTFMMSTKFIGLLIVRVGNQCRLSEPLTDVQRLYLLALNLSQCHLTNPSSAQDYG